ncbi:MAG TPA: hypothetical protein VIU65_08875 [Pyrinomonadaceae bacterium]
MIRKNQFLLGTVLLFCCGAAIAQAPLSNLKRWDGKYPTTKKGRVTTRFFAEPAIRTRLLKLLSREDYNLLTKEYAVETPVKKIGNYLVVKVCKPHMCFEQSAFAIDLTTGNIFVRMALDETPDRWLASQGSAADLPADVKGYMEDFSAT